MQRHSSMQMLSVLVRRVDIGLALLQPLHRNVTGKPIGVSELQRNKLMARPIGILLRRGPRPRESALKRGHAALLQEETMRDLS